MKYFSPSVLDGSITTAKLADDSVTTDKIVNFAVIVSKLNALAATNPKLGNSSVTQGKILASTSSQSGSIAGNSQVLVTLSAYTFFPDIEAAAALDEQSLLADNPAVPSATADTPKFRIDNSSGVSRLYSVEWRHVSA